MNRVVASLLFIAIAATLMSLVHVYLYRRYVRDVTANAAVRRAGKWAIALLAVAAIVARPLSQWLSTAFSVPATLVALGWMGFATYLFLAALAVDVGRLLVWIPVRIARGQQAPDAPPNPERRRLLVAALPAGAALVSGGGVAGGAFEALSPPRLTEVSVRLRGLPRALDGFTLVQLSDLHVGAVSQRAFVEDLVDRTNALRADLVAITGDLVDGTVEELGAFVAPLSRLASRHGTFFVTGNHDYYSGVGPWVAELERLGVNVLRNRWVRIGDAGGSFDLAGVDDWGVRERAQGGYDLAKAIAGREVDRPSVLLAHQPTNLDAVSRAGISLQLSGHTHGGQMFPATAFARLIWGEQVAGLSKYGDTQVFVSRGCGFVGPPLRVGSPAEIVKIVLLAG